MTRHKAEPLLRPLPGHSIGLAHSDEIYRQEEARILPHAARCKSDARQLRLARPPTYTHRRCAVLIRHEAGTLSRPPPGRSIRLTYSDETYRQEEARIHPHAARCKSDARQLRLARPLTPIGDVLF